MAKMTIPWLKSKSRLMKNDTSIRLSRCAAGKNTLCSYYNPRVKLTHLLQVESYREGERAVDFAYLQVILAGV